MTRDNIHKWLINFFSKKSDLAGYNDDELLSCNYIEKGFIDSLGIINLVMALEKEFDIKLSNSVFQDRRFVTISGLSEIITEIKT